MKILIATAVFALLAATGTTAHATCLIDGHARLAEPDCTPVGDAPPHQATWPEGVPLTFSARCQVCCSPPGGPLTCDPVKIQEYDVNVRHFDGPRLAGEFIETGVECGGPDAEDVMYRFESEEPMEPGAYEIMLGPGDILVSFDVVEREVEFDMIFVPFAASE